MGTAFSISTGNSWANSSALERIVSVANSSAVTITLNANAATAGIATVDLSAAITSTGHSIDVSAYTALGTTLTGSSTVLTSITGGAGADTITGGAGADVIAGNAGIDVMSGQGGNDTYVMVGNSDFVTGNAVIDSITDSAGADRILFADTGATVTVAATDILTRITGVEKFETVANSAIISITLNATNTAGTSFNHVDLSGDTNNTGVNVISSTGANGITSITGSDGIDTITLGAAAPATTVVGGAGADTLAMATGTTATITDGTIAVTITGAATVTMTGALTATSITGGTGVDTITLAGAVGNVATVTGGVGADVIDLGAATTGITSVVIAAGDSTSVIGGAGAAGTASVAFDAISNVTTGTTSTNKDKIDVVGTAALATAATVNGTDSTLLIGAAVVGEHTISATGLTTFVVANGGAAQVVTSDASLAAVLQYLAGVDIGNSGSSLVFTATYGVSTRGSVTHSFLYTQNTDNKADTSALDGFTLVDFIGVTLTGIETTASTTDARLFIA